MQVRARRQGARSAGEGRAQRAADVVVTDGDVGQCRVPGVRDRVGVVEDRGGDVGGLRHALGHGDARTLRLDHGRLHGGRGESVAAGGRDVGDEAGGIVGRGHGVGCRAARRAAHGQGAGTACECRAGRAADMVVADCERARKDSRTRIRDHIGVRDHAAGALERRQGQELASVMWRKLNRLPWHGRLHQGEPLPDAVAVFVTDPAVTSAAVTVYLAVQLVVAPAARGPVPHGKGVPAVYEVPVDHHRLVVGDRERARDRRAGAGVLDRVRVGQDLPD